MSTKMDKNDQENEVLSRKISKAVEMGTQTVEKTNVNIISNVRLSQTTLNTILSQVMKDLVGKSSNGLFGDKIVKSAQLKQSEGVIKTAETAETKEKPPNTPFENKLVKYAVGNVTSAKAMNRRDEKSATEPPPVVLRSTNLLNRTSSLEVNTSSSTGSDSDSDQNSLIDSLEGSPVPRRVDLNKFDDKPVRGDMYFVTSSGNSPKKKSAPSAFFVPIENNISSEVRAIADHFPSKLKERLSQRQSKRGQQLHDGKGFKEGIYISSHKMKHLQPDFPFPKSPSPNRKLEENRNTTISTKSILPSIGFSSLQSHKKEEGHVVKKLQDKSTQCKPVYRNQPPLSGSSNVGKIDRVAFLAKREKSPEKKSFQSDNKVVKEQSPVDGKRIRILEIMECVDGAPQEQRQERRYKSRIPKLIRPKLPKIAPMEKSPKVSYTRIKQVQDAKVDRLIANILIDTIHAGEVTNVSNVTFNNYRSKQHKRSISFNSGRPHTVPTDQGFYFMGVNRTQFEVIPEDVSGQSSRNSSRQEGSVEKGVQNEKGTQTILKEVYSPNTTNANIPELPKQSGKNLLSFNKNNDLKSIPKGWVTFYSSRKNQITSDSSSDDGVNVAKQH